MWLSLLACGKDDGPLSPPAVTEIDDAPLAARVAWITETALTTTLEVTCGDVAFEGTDPDPTTDHEAVVIGLVPGETCTFVVRATDDEGDWWTDAKSFSPGDTTPLPPLSVTGSGPLEPGWTLATLAREGSDSPGTVVLIDEQGRYRWSVSRWGYLSPAPGYDARVVTLDEDLTDGLVDPDGATGVLVGGFAEAFPPGIVTWDGRIVWDAGLDMHHEIMPTGDGTLMYLGYDTCDGLDTNALYEVDRRTGDVGWTWRSCDHLTVPEPPSTDWDHLNAFSIDGDPATGDLVVSARNLDLLIAIERSTGAVRWTLGAHGTIPLPDGETLFGPHGVSWTDAGTLLLVDNGDVDERPTTRVLELAVDPSAGTSEVVWSWDPGAFYAILGDAERLPHGGTLVVLGTPSTEGSHIYELDAAGTIVWDLTIEDGWAPNRAQRIEPPDLVVFVSPGT